MAHRREIIAVYSAAVIQGVVLVTFPAVSAIFTNSAQYGLSTTQYGGMFAPQAATAIAAALFGAGLTRRFGGKHVFLLGLGADLFAMALLFGSQFAMSQQKLAYGLLLTATAFLGIGFGFTVPALNTFTAAFFPAKTDAAILTLNALLGLGTALAPIFATIFVGLGIWWGLPILMSALSLALLLFSAPLPLNEAAPSQAERDAKPASRHTMKIPSRFWAFAAFAFVYGVCETMNANWATVYMSGTLGASTMLASIALTTFWVAVTSGRVLFAAIEKWLPQKWTYRLLPLLMVLGFLLTATVPKGSSILAILYFALAGVGCSALLPLVISFGQKELIPMAASVAGGMIGFYQMGYGLAAFGVGPLQKWWNLSLAAVYAYCAACALSLVILAFTIVASRPKRA